MASHVNCRVGDLALVVSALNPENVGQLVEILGPADGKPFRLCSDAVQWRVRCAGGVCGLRYEYPDGRMVSLIEGPVPDSCLRPLRDREVVPALVDLAVEAMKATHAYSTPTSDCLAAGQRKCGAGALATRHSGSWERVRRDEVREH